MTIDKPIDDVSAIRFLGTEVAEKFPVVKTWQVAPPSAVDEEKLITAKGPYVPWRNISLSNAYPVLQGYKNTAGIGYHFNFDDPLQFASLGITGAYTPSNSLPSNERGHVDITGRYRFWRAELSWNRSDFYDLFGPVKRSRKGYAAKLGYDWELHNDEPRKLDLIFDFGYFDQIDTCRMLRTSRPTSPTCDRRRSGSATDLKARRVRSTTKGIEGN